MWPEAYTVLEDKQSRSTPRLTPAVTSDRRGLLTKALRDRLAQSRASRLETLLRHQQLGDQRPSENLRRIQGELTIAGVAPTDNGLLRTLYKQRLPQSVRAALSLLSEDTPLADLASAADRFLEANAAAPAPAASGPVFTVQHSPPAPSQTAMDQLNASVAALTAAVGQMRTAIDGMRQQEQQRRFRSRGGAGRAPSSSRLRSPSRNHGLSLCYYHQRFGAAAWNCAEPCSWSQQQGNGQARRDQRLIPRASLLQDGGHSGRYPGGSTKPLH